MTLQRLRLFFLVTKSVKPAHVQNYYALVTNFRHSRQLSIGFRQEKGLLSDYYQSNIKVSKTSQEESADSNLSFNSTNNNKQVSSKSYGATFGATIDHDLKQSTSDKVKGNVEKNDSLKHNVSVNQVTGTFQDDEIVDEYLAETKSNLKRSSDAVDVNDNSWLNQLDHSYQFTLGDRTHTQMKKDLAYSQRNSDYYHHHMRPSLAEIVPDNLSADRKFDGVQNRSLRIARNSQYLSAWCDLRLRLFQCRDMEVLEEANHVTSTGFYVSLRLLKPQTANGDIREFLWPLEVGTISRQFIKYKGYPRIIAYADLNSEFDVEFATMKTNLCMDSKEKVLVVRHFQPSYPPECYLKVYGIPRRAKSSNVMQIFRECAPKRVIFLYSCYILQGYLSALIEFENQETAEKAKRSHYKRLFGNDIRVEQPQMFNFDMKGVNCHERLRQQREEWAFN